MLRTSLSLSILIMSSQAIWVSTGRINSFMTECTLHLWTSEVQDSLARLKLVGLNKDFRCIKGKVSLLARLWGKFTLAGLGDVKKATLVVLC